MEIADYRDLVAGQVSVESLVYLDIVVYQDFQDGVVIQESVIRVSADGVGIVVWEFLVILDGLDKMDNQERVVFLEFLDTLG